VLNYFTSLSSPEDIQLVNESLLATAFAPSEDLLGSLKLLEAEEENDFLTFPFLASNDLDPLLLLLYFLFHNSPPFYTFAAFRAQGMSQEQQEHLGAFFKQRMEALEIQNSLLSSKEPVIVSLDSEERLPLLQKMHEEVLDKIKQNDYPGFTEKLNALYNQQKTWQEEAKQKMEHLWEAEDEDYGAKGALQTHQKDVVDMLERHQKVYVDALNIFAKAEFYQGMREAQHILELHNQILQLCENSVALFFFGNSNVGKSTIVNGMLGSHLSPMRSEPMTAVPVRYLHDPSLSEPTMKIPFHQQLNQVVREIKLFIEQKGFDAVKPSFNRGTLSNFLDKINEGLEFVPLCKGEEEVREAFVCLHDLYHMVTQRVFPASLLKHLPLSWTREVHNFVTVNLNLTNLLIPPKLAKTVKLSIVDTPSMNDEGMRKLELENSVLKASEFCHVVSLLMTHWKKDATPFKEKMIECQHDTFTPNLVIVTHCENMNQLDAAGTPREVANLLRFEEKVYPEEQVRMVGGKRYLLSKLLLNELDRTGKKPPADHHLFEDWILDAMKGMNETEKIDSYNRLTIESLRSACEKMMENSKVPKLHQILINTIMHQSTYLSANKAIQNTIRISKKTVNLLEQIISKHQLGPDLIIETYVEHFQRVIFGINEVRNDLREQLKTLRTILEISIQQYLEEPLKQIQEKDVQLDETDPTAAKKEIEGILSEKKRSLCIALDQILEKKQEDIQNLTRAVKAATEEKVLQPLREIVEEAKMDEDRFSVNLSLSDMKLDTETFEVAVKYAPSDGNTGLLQSWLGYFWGSQSTHLVADSEQSSLALAAQVTNYGKRIVEQAVSEVEKSIDRVLDRLFLAALRKVTRIIGAIGDKERFDKRCDEIQEVFEELHEHIQLVDSYQKKVELALE